ncbi:putative solute carrier family 12 (potassium/chloride transporters), member 7 [Cyclobacterium qasimii M12-11B]|uniref:Putative solute carrier family 12 (Potassium/chloride transporters), member 7 n=1 Tax=Cyclobacterium qasimii M12-11B TaxID=641524 RepID=S7VLJ7_9BACT|nr:putative solute carrier family 12 (potassium/chloride transporters), member 7 [Cyclobacterium qasimii M12-11B]
MLTILGVIMYLRFGWVVGNVGLIGTLLIVTLSTAITFLTSLSISAIATNAPVKGGGAYYLISRSLGAEIGGAVGIPLYLAQAFSVSLYVIGFSESVVAIFPTLDIKWVGIITTVFLGGLALFSTTATIKSQFFIMGLIAISLLSLALGSPMEDSHIELWGVPAAQSVDFWQVFAIFFPAVTGIMAGVNMSGDLKDPAKSIPKGTFMAIGVGYVIYMILPIILASRADASTLIENPLIMQQIAIWGGAIVLGIWGATLSSATGSLLGAPRVLQALANDKILPKWANIFSRVDGKEKIPRAATLFTIALTLVTVYFGNLNLIAPVLTMFFLTTYAVLNITAATEHFLGSASFRPKFKVHWVFSLLGAIGCAGVMILINALATIMAFLVIAIIFVWLKRRKIEATWGGLGRGVFSSIIRYALFRLEKESNAKSWRPNILVLSGSPGKRWRLIELADDITNGNALFTVTTIVSETNVPQEKVKDYENRISDYLGNKNVQALVKVVRASDPFSGATHMVNSYGLGQLVPNTILLGDTRENRNLLPYSEMIRHFFKSRKNVIIVQDEGNVGFKKKEVIDIWWGGLKKNGSLMIILAYLLKNSREWQQASVNVKMVVPNKEAYSGAKDNLDKIFESMRTGFDYQILIADGRVFWDIMAEESKNSDLIMMGLAIPEEEGAFEDYYVTLKERTKSLPTKVFVLAGQEVEFDKVLI